MKFLQWLLFANACILIFIGASLKLQDLPSYKYTFVAGILNFSAFIFIAWYRSKINRNKIIIPSQV